MSLKISFIRGPALGLIIKLVLSGFKSPGLGLIFNLGLHGALDYVLNSLVKFIMSPGIGLII